MRLPGAESLPPEFSRWRLAPPDDVPARWSDGVPITAADVVYSWRRYLAPETASPGAVDLHYLKGGKQVNSGARPPGELGIRALDEFSFEVELEAPAAHLLMLCYSPTTTPLPRHAIEAARRRGREESWTEPANIVTSGPFLLRESNPRERTVVVRNPTYYDAGLAGIDGIEFVAADGAVVLNLFRSGLADSMDARALPLQLAPSLRDRGDFHARPALANHNWRISTTRPPLDNVLLRYALNMATDKVATARLLGTGQAPAKCRVPPLDGYRSLDRLLVDIDGNKCDVLAFDPRAARELWAKAAPTGMATLPIHHFALHDSAILAEILRYQWRTHLGIEARAVPMEPQLYVRSIWRVETSPASPRILSWAVTRTPRLSWTSTRRHTGTGRTGASTPRSLRLRPPLIRHFGWCGWPGAKPTCCERCLSSPFTSTRGSTWNARRSGDAVPKPGMMKVPITAPPAAPKAAAPAIIPTMTPNPLRISSTNAPSVWLRGKTFSTCCAIAWLRLFGLSPSCAQWATLPSPPMSHSNTLTLSW